MSSNRVCAVTLLLWVCASAPVMAQPAPGLAAALDHYAAAAYDEALAALDALRHESLSMDARVSVEQHRMLCLLALGRADDAEGAAGRLLEARPTFALSAAEASPRVRALFAETRRRLLPGLVRRLYAEARGAFDAGDTATARDGFVRLGPLLADPDVLAADGAFRDLGLVVEGFVRLSTAALAAASPAAAPEVPLPAAPAPPPFAPIGIFTYDWRDKAVVAPVAQVQTLSGWWGTMGEPPAGTLLGAVDVVVDEQGRVAEVRMHQSVNRIYDAVLMQSVKQWRYHPATRDGRAVRYRRVTSVVSGRDGHATAARTSR